MTTDECCTEKNTHPAAKVAKIVAMVIGGIILAVFLAFLFGYVVKLLWNWLMPVVFGLPIITYWQAIAMIILGKLIFGSIGGHHHDHHDKQKKHPGRIIKDEIGREIKKEFAKEFDKEFDKVCRSEFEKYWKMENGAQGEGNKEDFKEFWQTDGKWRFEEFLEGKKRQG